jgi:hypothetical protein
VEIFNKPEKEEVEEKKLYDEMHYQTCMDLCQAYIR